MRKIFIILLFPTLLQAQVYVKTGGSTQVKLGGSNVVINAPSTGDTPLTGATYINTWDVLYDADLGLTKAVAGTGSVTENTTDYLRSAGTKSLHFVSNGVRCEVHTKFNYLGVEEGDIVYLGWSDYYVTLPINQYTTFQFRDQDQNITGCPSIQFGIAGSYWDLGTVNGLIVRLKEGAAGRAAIIPNMSTGKWYDIVVAIKYKKDGTGFFKIWAGEAGTLNYDNVTYSYTGATMYSLEDMGTPTEPCDYDYEVDYFNSPHLRIGGCYQWGTVAPFESYKGPLRINVGEDSKTAFLKVIPR